MTSMCLCLLGGDLVQTGVVWEGVRGILLDTETAECNMRRDIFFWRKENRKEREKQRKKEKKKETSLINVPFCQEKATHFWVG